jgi:hypothetical protein
MIYEDRVLCFVDVLGFRSQIQQTVDKQGNEVPARTENITEAFLHIRDLVDIDIRSP